MVNLKLELDARKKKASIFVLGDLHFLSPSFNEPAWQNTVKYIKKHDPQNTAVLINGDVTDGILVTDRKRYAFEHHIPKENALGYIRERTIEYLKPLRNYIFSISHGNHDQSLIKYNNIDVVDEVVKYFNSTYKNSDIKYGGYRALTDIVVYRHNETIFRQLYQHHGLGANSPVTKGMLDYARITVGTAADFIIISHKHNCLTSTTTGTRQVDGKTQTYKCYMLQGSGYNNLIEMSDGSEYVNTSFEDRCSYTLANPPSFIQISFSPVEDISDAPRLVYP